MEFIKKIMKDIEFHLNAKERSLSITYGENEISLHITEDGIVKYSSNLVLSGPREESPAKAAD